jgi:PAS domain S-box-containing protein
VPALPQGIHPSRGAQSAGLDRLCSIGEEREEAVAFILDLTAQKGVEDALRRSEERYRSLIAATTSIVWTAGPSGEFVEPQEAWDAYTGQSWEEHRGFGWFAMVHEEDRERMQTQWQQAIATSTRWLGNGRVWHQESREHRHFEVRAVPIFDTFGKVREWVGTAVDMHEHRLAQEAEHRARREAEAANRAKDEFLAVLSHELRTPLTPAFLSIDELMENPQLPEAVRAELTVVRRNLGTKRS